MKATTVASTAVLLPALPACRPESGCEIRVGHEWDALKAAVVGLPYLKLPPDIPLSLHKKLSPRWRAFLESSPGSTLEQAHPRLFENISRQMDAAADILKARGVRVCRVGPMTSADERYLSEMFPPCGAQLYPRDPLLVIGPHIIETEPAFPYRRRERFGIRRALAAHMDIDASSIISMPPARPHMADGKWDDGPLLEGGDVMVLGRDILVGISGNASNVAGVGWLARLLGDACRVQAVRIDRRFLHLDCCLCTPRPGLAVICRAAFIDGLPPCLKGWDLIEVSAQEAGRFFACNGLIIDSETMMLPSGLPDLCNKLRAAGQEVIETPFDAVGFFGGSLRCWHQALLRQGGV